MHVTELNDNELYELKDKLYCDAYYDSDNLPSMTDAQICEVYDAEYPDGISDELIFDVYDGIGFVKDDFFCNA